MILFVFCFIVVRFNVCHVVVMTSPSGGAYMGGGQMPRRDGEFHQIVTVLGHTCGVNGVTKVPARVLLPILGRREVNVQLSSP